MNIFKHKDGNDIKDDIYIPDFDAEAYLKHYPDVAKHDFFGSRPALHYQLHGLTKGRTFYSLSKKTKVEQSTTTRKEMMNLIIVSGWREDGIRTIFRSLERANSDITFDCQEHNEIYSNYKFKNESDILSSLGNFDTVCTTYEMPTYGETPEDLYSSFSIIKPFIIWCYGDPLFAYYRAMEKKNASDANKINANIIDRYNQLNLSILRLSERYPESIMLLDIMEIASGENPSPLIKDFCGLDSGWPHYYLKRSNVNKYPSDSVKHDLRVKMDDTHQKIKAMTNDIKGFNGCIKENDGIVKSKRITTFESDAPSVLKVTEQAISIRPVNFYGVHDVELLYNNVHRKLAKSKDYVSVDNCYIGYSNAWPNYWHWLQQCLCSIHLYNKYFNLDKPLILPCLDHALSDAFASEFHSKSLAYLDIDDSNIINVPYKGTIKIRKAVMSRNLLNWGRVFSPEEVEFYDILKSNVGLNGSSIGRRIYISRNDSKKELCSMKKRLFSR